MTLKPGWAADEAVSKQQTNKQVGEGKMVAVWRPNQPGDEPTVSCATLST